MSRLVLEDTISTVGSPIVPVLLPATFHFLLFFLAFIYFQLPDPGAFLILLSKVSALLQALSLELDYLGFPYFGVGRMEERTVVPGNPGSRVALDASNPVGDDVAPVIGEDVVPAKKATGKRKVTDGGASSKQPVTEKKCSGSGLLRGYILKMDSKEKTESSYDFVNYSWVDPSIMETISVYRSSEETVAFTKENDFVRKISKVRWSVVVKMSPKLDKSAMVRRIVEKKREADKVKDEQPTSGEVKLAENLEKSEPSDVVKEAQTSTEEVSKKRKRGKVADEIHNISYDDNRAENIVDVFQEFVGSSPEVAIMQYIKGLSNVDTLRKRVTDLEKDLSGVEELRTKVVGLEDELSQMKSDKEVAKATLLQEKVEHKATKSKSATDRDQLTVEAADSYDSGFNQALEQVNIFYPDVDTSVCNVLKEAVGGVLVDLISGENEPHVEFGQTNALVETVAEKVTFKGEGEESESATEVLGNAPRI
ncbi:hypothetical protein SESBI_42494 [Sesbania bispinosa]|nr:hypothetical protein SESBI_42494 [Sesbania bispinosa]